jgi:hypothetical protein
MEYIRQQEDVSPHDGGEDFKYLECEQMTSVICSHSFPKLTGFSR